jgi:hypothetical protein
MIARDYATYRSGDPSLASVVGCGSSAPSQRGQRQSLHLRTCKCVHVEVRDHRPSVPTPGDSTAGAD